MQAATTNDNFAENLKQLALKAVDKTKNAITKVVQTVPDKPWILGLASIAVLFSHFASYNATEMIVFKDVFLNAATMGLPITALLTNVFTLKGLTDDADTFSERLKNGGFQGIMMAGVSATLFTAMAVILGMVYAKTGTVSNFESMGLSGPQIMQIAGDIKNGIGLNSASVAEFMTFIKTQSPEIIQTIENMNIKEAAQAANIIKPM